MGKEAFDHLDGEENKEALKEAVSGNVTTPPETVDTEAAKPVENVTTPPETVDKAADTTADTVPVGVEVDSTPQHPFPTSPAPRVSSRYYGNTDSDGAQNNTNDLVLFGDPNAWVLIAKASSQSQGWMKSTKAMTVAGVGVLVQVTTNEGGRISEALTFVPGAAIKLDKATGCRKLIKG